MICPLDLQRLAVRIAGLQQSQTADWDPADEMEFLSRLPDGRDPRRLPDPQTLRGMAERMEVPSAAQWQLWISTAQHLDDLARANDPHNPRRMIRDLARGRLPRT